jgi:transcriptional regulator with XRE-family HTH domain
VSKLILFADLLKDYRSDKGLSQVQLAALVGFSSQYICDLEKGYRSPSVNFVDRFTNAMEMSAGEAKIWHLLAARACGWNV